MLQCENCMQYLLEDRVLSRVDEILARVDNAAELEIIRYAVSLQDFTLGGPNQQRP